MRLILASLVASYLSLAACIESGEFSGTCAGSAKVEIKVKAYSSLIDLKLVSSNRMLDDRLLTVFEATDVPFQVTSSAEGAPDLLTLDHAALEGPLAAYNSSRIRQLIWQCVV